MEIDKELITSRLPGVKYLRTFSNFFQSAKQRYANLGPDSGVHLVGPMFELMACVENKNTTEYDAIYPDSGLSYGPTICSFGLPYNDHNYALPSGLTPPNMAPHLMDLNLASISLPSKITSETVTSSPTKTPQTLENAISTVVSAKSVIATVQPSSTSKENVPNPVVKAVKELAVNKSLTPTTMSGAHLLLIPTINIADNRTPRPLSPPSELTPARNIPVDTEIAESIADSISGLSEPRKTLFGAWHTKAAATGGTLLVQHHWKDNHVSDKEKRTMSKNSSAVIKSSGSKSPLDELECRYELEMKIIEVPEDICVSPSQLSVLESDSEDEDETTLPYQDSTSDPTGDATANLSQKSTWLPVQCSCEMKSGYGKMLKCIQCRMLQHRECMERLYRDGHAPPSSTKEDEPPVARVQMATLLEPATYLCPTCLNHPVEQVAVDELKKVARERQADILPGFEQTSGHKAANASDEIGGGNVSTKSMTGAAQLLANATDRARQLGLIVSSSEKQEHSWNTKKVQASRRATENTDVNLRIPSPPRASKRKQDLTNKAHNEPGRLPSDDPQANTFCDGDSPPTGELTHTSSDSLGLGVSRTPSITPSSTPSGTPAKAVHYHHMQVYSAPGEVLDGDSPMSYRASASGDSTPTTSPMSSRKRPRRTLFPDKRRKHVVDTTLSTLGSAWAKNYQEADASIYSHALLSFISAQLAAGRERNQRIQPTFLGRTPLCHVVLFDHDDKGLDASVRLAQGEIVTELRGNLMLLEEYEHFVDPTTEYNRYVMLYHDLSERDIAIDTTQYGNDARFIRRSCTPNCKLEHYIVCGKLRMVIRTIQEVLPGVELTLPFDPDYHACSYPLTCACARSRCPVQKWCRKLVRKKVMPNLDYGKYITSRLRDLSQPLSDESSRSFVSAEYASATSSPVSHGELSPMAGRQHLVGGVGISMSPQRFTTRSGNSSTMSTPNKPAHPCPPVFPPPARQIFKPVNQTVSLSAHPVVATSDKLSPSETTSKSETAQVVDLPSIEPEKPTPDTALSDRTDSPPILTSKPIAESSATISTKQPARLSPQSSPTKWTKNNKSRIRAESPPPFEPIITTRRQAAMASRVSTTSKTPESTTRRTSKRFS